MATRNENADIRQQNADAQQTSEVGTERRTDRERDLQVSREGRSPTALTRSEAPGWGLRAGAPIRSPFALMRRVMEDMDRIFEDFGLGRGIDFGREFGFGRGLMSPLFGSTGRDLWGDVSGGAPALWSPAVEVLEKRDKLVVRAELPGVSKDDVSVDITGDALTIEGERRQESEDRGEGYYRSERSYGRFLRSIPLPEGVDPDKAEAKFKDGVLEITLPLPKSERKRGRKLQIR